MSKVYQKMGLFGRTYWHDNGLFVKQISKKKHDEIIMKVTVHREVARQLKQHNKKQGR